MAESAPSSNRASRRSSMREDVPPLPSQGLPPLPNHLLTSSNNNNNAKEGKNSIGGSGLTSPEIDHQGNIKYQTNQLSEIS